MQWSLVPQPLNLETQWRKEQHPGSTVIATREVIKYEVALCRTLMQLKKHKHLDKSPSILHSSNTATTVTVTTTATTRRVRAAAAAAAA
jgi:hypothetical protein